MLVLFLCFVNVVFSQVNRVTYKIGIYGKDVNNLVLSPEKKAKLDQKTIELMESIYKHQAESEFVLLFDKNKYLYKRVEKLDVDDKNDLGMKSFGVLNSSIYYKNTETKEKISQIADGISVIKPFNQFVWQIGTETKMIDGYKCYKATTTLQDGYNPYKNTTNVFTPIAWFCPEIPAQFGPDGLDGLPGLILEGSINGGKYFYATKIEFDVNDLKIEKPKGIKTMTEEEYSKKIMDDYNNNVRQ